jgi:hypothetical protein
VLHLRCSASVLHDAIKISFRHLMSASSRVEQTSRRNSGGGHTASTKREREVTTENEMAAFVGRVTRWASLKGSHRAVFVGVRPLIERSLDAGHSMKATWEVLHAEGKVTMTYETFRAHCRKAGLGHAAPRRGGARARADGQRIVASAAPQTALQERADDRPRGFQHNRVPRKKDIY